MKMDSTSAVSEQMILPHTDTYDLLVSPTRQMNLILERDIWDERLAKYLPHFLGDTSMYIHKSMCIGTLVSIYLLFGTVTRASLASLASLASPPISVSSCVLGKNAVINTYLP